MTPTTRRSLLLLPLLACPLLAYPPRARAEIGAAGPLPLDDLMRRLAAIPERRARFREERRFAALTETLASKGTLFYRRPDYLEKITEWPFPERMIIDGDRLIIDQPGNEPPRVVDLSGQPELRAMAEAMRGPLAGDLDALRRSFQIEAAGTLAAWTLALIPTDPPAAKLLRVIRLSGQNAWIGDIRLVQPNGDEQWLRIDPA